MYIIKKSRGSWDDYSEDSQFITESEKYAKSYCDKANNLLIKLKDFFVEIDNKLEEMGISDDEIEDKDRHKFLVDLWIRYHRFGETNRWYYEPIEIRKIK
jgi:hypothetical protein